MACGVLDKAGQWATPVRKPDFLFPTPALSAVFRGKFMATLDSQSIGGFDHKGVQVFQASPRQLVAGLGKTPIRNAPLPITVNRQAAIKGVEHDLL